MTALETLIRATPPANDLPDSMICGVDLSGFSRWLDGEIERRGDDALEAIADGVSQFLNLAVAAIEAEGFALGCLLGDGFIAVCPGPASPGAVTRLRAAMHMIEPSARVVIVAGAAQAIALPGWDGRHDSMLSGAGVVDCHVALDAQPRTTTLARPLTGGAVAGSETRLVDAEFADMVVMFACLQGRPPPPMALDLLQRRLPAWQAMADALGGRFERITHDDNGYLLRFAWLNAPGADDAARRLAAAIENDCGGITVGTGVATGMIFRAGLAGLVVTHDHDRTIIQGTAVNRAAKHAKHGTASRVRAAVVAVPHARNTPGATGREAELQWLIDRLADPATARIVVTGAPGMGKSHLLRALGAATSTLTVAATPQHCLDPLWLWDELIAALPEAIATRHAVTMATLATARGTEDAVVLLERHNEAIIEALANAVAIGADRVIVIDDLQWADAASHRMVARVATALPTLRLVAGGREGHAAVAPHLAGAAHLALTPLSPAALAVATAAAGVVAPPPDVIALAQGNPLHAIQLAFAAHETTGDFDGGSIVAVIDARVAALPTRDRALLRLLAIAGRSLPRFRLLALASSVGIDPDQINLGILADRAFVAIDDDHVALVHRRLGDRVAALTPPSVRAMLHLRTARLLVVAHRAGDIACGRGEIAAHWAAAGAAARAAIAYALAGDAALDDGDFSSAHQLFTAVDAALQSTRSPDVRRADAAAGRGMAAWGQGNLRQAGVELRVANRHIEAAFAGTRGQAAGRLRWMRVVGRRADVSPRLRQAMLRASVLRIELGFFRGSMRDFALGSAVALRLNDNSASRVALRCRCMGAAAATLGLLHLRTASLWLIGRCRAIDPEGRPASTAAGGEALWRLAAGEWDRGAALLDEARDRLGTPVDPHLLGGIVCMRALQWHLRGKSDAALADFAEVGAIADRIGNVQFAAWSKYGRAMPLLALGRVAEAETEVAASEWLLKDNDDLLSDLNCAGLRARISLARGEYEAAIDHADQGLALCQQLFPANFGSIEGYSAPAIVAASLARNAGIAPETRRRAAALLRPALVQLRRYVRICGLGAPRLQIARALAETNPVAARRHALRAIALADKLAMPFDSRAAHDLILLLERPADAAIYQPRW